MPSPYELEHNNPQPCDLERDRGAARLEEREREERGRRGRGAWFLTGGAAARAWLATVETNEQRERG